MFRLLTGTKSDLVNGALAAVYLALLIIVWLVPEPITRLTAYAVMALLALIAWTVVFKRYRLIIDTPTAQAASAAQGYVALSGRCALHPGSEPLQRAMGPKCVWYRMRTYRITDNGWQKVGDELTGDTFLLIDGSGRCVIDPDEAEVITSNHRTWSSGQYRYYAEYLEPGESLYAIGRLTTSSAADVPLKRQEDVRALLADWKSNPRQLIERFDTNRDGDLDLEEWEAARRAAEAQVAIWHRELAANPDVNILGTTGEPAHPYILANRPPRLLARHLAWWTGIHFAALLVAALGAVYTGN